MFSIIEKIIATPFGYVMDWLYKICGNYGVALILFAIVVKLAMAPLEIRNRRNSEKRAALKPIEQRLQEKYREDHKKQDAALVALYEQEKISLGGGCLLSALPFIILLSLFQVLYQPLVYMLHETPDHATAIVEAMKDAAPSLFKSSAYTQLIAACHISEYTDIIKATLPDVAESTLSGINIFFLGMDLSTVPLVNIFADTWAWDWAHIAAALLPLLYISRQLFQLIKFIITNIKKELKEEKPSIQRMIQPGSLAFRLFALAMTFSVTFSVPAGLILYWLTGSFIQYFIDKWYKKHYTPYIPPVDFDIEPDPAN